MKLISIFLLPLTYCEVAQILCKTGESELYTYDESTSLALDVLLTRCRYLENRISEFEETSSFKDLSFDDVCYIYNRELFSSDAELYTNLKNIYEADPICSNSMRDASSPFEKLNGYGCYCKMNDQSFRGYGKPINSFDEECMIVQQAYLCADQDTAVSLRKKRDTFQCGNKFTGYFVNSGGGLVDACELFNGILAAQEGWSAEEEDCAIRKCKIDTQFILSMMSTALGQGESFDDSGIWIENGGTFDRETECGPRLHPDAMARVEDCCGMYPSRQILRRSQRCCKSNSFERVYHWKLEQCCNVAGEYSVVESGECGGEVIGDFNE